MQHCTPEQLALAALREPLPADDAAHLDGLRGVPGRGGVAAAQRRRAGRPRVRGPGRAGPAARPRLGVDRRGHRGHGRAAARGPSGRRRRRSPAPDADRPAEPAVVPLPPRAGPAASAARRGGSPWSARPSAPAPSRLANRDDGAGWLAAADLDPLEDSDASGRRRGGRAARTAPACSRSLRRTRPRRRLLRGLAARARRRAHGAGGRRPGGHHGVRVPGGPGPVRVPDRRRLRRAAGRRSDALRASPSPAACSRADGPC